MSRRAARVAVALVLLAAAGAWGQTPASQAVALKGARIVPVTGPEIAEGTIVLRDGKIESVAAGLAVPDGARVVEAKGLRAYPGMIDAYSFLGLQEITGVQATVDNRETGRINPQVRSIEALRYDSMHIPITRSNGITSALVAPTGGLVAGQSTVIQLDGWTNREMIVKSPAFLQVELPALRGARGGFGGAAAGAPVQDAGRLLAEVKDLLAKARAYEKRRAAAAKDVLLPRPEFDDVLEALLPAARGELPLMISVHAEKDIRAAVQFVKESGLKAVFYGAEQGFKAAGEIKAAGIPVILGSLYDQPAVWEDGYDALYMNPGLLHRAGVKIAFSSSSATVAKDLPYHAAKAAAFGLDKAEALRAVTINPAEIFGLADRLGSLEKGKRADVVLADGDLLELRTNIKAVYIGGREVDLANRYTELLEKFRRRGR